MQDLKPSYIKTFANDDLELSTEDLSVLYGGKIKKIFYVSLPIKKQKVNTFSVVLCLGK